MFDMKLGGFRKNSEVMKLDFSFRTWKMERLFLVHFSKKNRRHGLFTLPKKVGLKHSN